MSFMQTQVTKRIQWRMVENRGETRYVPSADYTPESGDVVETVVGYGVRQSAPGYLDCTEWEVFETLAAAEARAAEIDAEDEDDA